MYQPRGRGKPRGGRGGGRGASRGGSQTFQYKIKEPKAEDEQHPAAEEVPQRKPKFQPKNQQPAERKPSPQKYRPKQPQWEKEAEQRTEALLDSYPSEEELTGPQKFRPQHDVYKPKEQPSFNPGSDFRMDSQPFNMGTSGFTPSGHDQQQQQQFNQQQFQQYDQYQQYNDYGNEGYPNQGYAYDQQYGMNHGLDYGYEQDWQQDPAYYQGYYDQHKGHDEQPQYAPKEEQRRGKRGGRTDRGGDRGGGRGGDRGGRHERGGREDHRDDGDEGHTRGGRGRGNRAERGRGGSKHDEEPPRSKKGPRQYQEKQKEPREERAQPEGGKVIDFAQDRRDREKAAQERRKAAGDFKPKIAPIKEELKKEKFGTVPQPSRKGRRGDDDGNDYPEHHKKGGKYREKDEYHPKKHEDRDKKKGRGSAEDHPDDDYYTAQRPQVWDEMEKNEPAPLSYGEQEDGAKYDDFDDDEFKWNDEDFKDEFNEFGYAEDHTSASSQGSGPGGNNQISMKNFARGEFSDKVKSPCSVMMVAEKPSIAKSITEALCGNKFEQRSGPAKGIPIFTFKGHFKGYSANFKVTSVAGHVYNRDFPQEFQNRGRDAMQLFDAPTVRKCDKRARPVAKHLQMVSKNCDFFVLWLDCDKEGENICFEVLDICKFNIPKSSNRLQRVYRAKFSSIATKDIVSAFEGLKDGPNYNEAISVDARQVLDLKIGVAFSRYQTNALAQQIRKAGIRMLTYGPCQTPTLGFCVEQAEKIKKFVPEPFWRVQAEIIDSYSGEKYKMKWCRGKIYDKTAVTVIHRRLQNFYGASEAEILSVKRTGVKQQRPQGLNTVKLLKVGSQSFGLSAFETMKIAEHLYLRGFTTYPRTESTTFSPNFNFKEVLTSLKEHEDYGGYASDLLKYGFNKPRKGVDAGDHPPITPVKAALPGQLHDRELKVYEYITSNFLACISKDASYDEIRMEALIGDEKFKMKGQILTDSGFVEVQPWQRHADKEIPEFQVGDIIDVKSLKIVEDRTPAPGFLSEADLIALMEANGIGTDASIPTHISNIIERNYVTVKENRKLVPTPLGQALVKGFCEIDPELVLPKVRSNIEKSCELIARGRVDFLKVVTHVLKIFKGKFNHFKLNVGAMQRLMSIMLSTSIHDKKSLACITNHIKLKDESKDTYINFCVTCFRGHICIQYHKSKGWGFKCDTCNYAIRLCNGAARVKKIENEDMRCEECNSFQIEAVYNKDSPFPDGASAHEGCPFCDTWLRATIRNLTSKPPKLMTAAEAEEARKLKEERKKQKEEKKLLAQQQPPEAQKPQDLTKKKKKKAGAPVDFLTAEERMNEFMKKKFGGATD